MNQFNALGFLPNEVKTTFMADGKTVLSTTLIIPYEGLRGEKKREMESQGKPTADIIPLTFFGKPAETVANNKERIKSILIKGASIKSRSWETSEHEKKYTNGIVVNSYREFTIIWKNPDVKE